MRRSILIFCSITTDCCRYFIVSVWIVAALVASPFLVYRKVVELRVSYENKETMLKCFVSIAKFLWTCVVIPILHGCFPKIS